MGETEKTLKKNTMTKECIFTALLILMEKKIPAVGVAAYALMAAGGDLGASVSPQMVGIVVDAVTVTDWANAIGSALSLSAEQIGFKTGMLAAAFFPILGVILLLYMRKFFQKSRKSQ